LEDLRDFFIIICINVTLQNMTLKKY
jgi:hypothetical protein